MRGSGGARSGLASHGVAPAVLSGAAVGHDRVRDGTGWGHRALGHETPPPFTSDGIAGAHASADGWVGGRRSRAGTRRAGREYWAMGG